MFLDFSFKNFRSFRDRTVLSLEPVPKQTGLDWSIRREKGGRRTFEALSTAVLLGPNASGKSGVACAFDVFRAIVLRGCLRNGPEGTGREGCPAARRLELVPGLTEDGVPAEPVEFAIRFVTEETLLDYRVRLDLGRFLETDAPRRVLEEELHVNGALVMKRSADGGLLVDTPLGTRRYMNDGEGGAELQARLALARRSLAPDELFLTGAFGVLFSLRIATLFTDWIRTRMEVFFPRDDTFFPTAAGPELERLNALLAEAAPRFGITESTVFLERPEGAAAPVLRSRLPDGRTVPAELVESRGTVRFLQLLVRVLGAIGRGGLLVVDDMDAVIHSTALMNIVGMLHSDELNAGRAQLVFTAHNPVFLNPGLFRRDEIEFVDRDGETGGSYLYSLADFGTFGTNGVRKDEDYLKKYFEGKYGAINLDGLDDVTIRFLSGGSSGAAGPRRRMPAGKP